MSGVSSGDLGKEHVHSINDMIGRMSHKNELLKNFRFIYLGEGYYDGRGEEVKVKGLLTLGGKTYDFILSDFFNDMILQECSQYLNNSDGYKSFQRYYLYNQGVSSDQKSHIQTSDLSDGDFSENELCFSPEEGVASLCLQNNSGEKLLLHPHILPHIHSNLVDIHADTGVEIGHKKVYELKNIDGGKLKYYVMIEGNGKTLIKSISLLSCQGIYGAKELFIDSIGEVVHTIGGVEYRRARVHDGTDFFPDVLVDIDTGELLKNSGGVPYNVDIGTHNPILFKGKKCINLWAQGEWNVIDVESGKVVSNFNYGQNHILRSGLSYVLPDKDNHNIDDYTQSKAVSCKRGGGISVFEMELGSATGHREHLGRGKASSSLVVETFKGLGLEKIFEGLDNMKMLKKSDCGLLNDKEVNILIMEGKYFGRTGKYCAIKGCPLFFLANDGKVLSYQEQYLWSSGGEFIGRGNMEPLEDSQDLTPSHTKKIYYDKYGEAPSESQIILYQRKGGTISVPIDDIDNVFYI